MNSYLDFRHDVQLYCRFFSEIMVESAFIDLLPLGQRTMG